QYLTDLLDGAVGRERNTGLVKWGYYMDHFLDYIFLCSILIGYGLMVEDHNKYFLFYILMLFGAFMVNSFLSFAATGNFRISYLGVGPTEMRLVFILVNTVIILFHEKFNMILLLPVTLAGATFGLFFVVYQTQKQLWKIDMEAKRNAEK
ncbi:MAG: CDP-alcohol phosphatidyltransferase family protein, partial [Kiritimatiellales bacterium]